MRTLAQKKHRRPQYTRDRRVPLSISFPDPPRLPSIGFTDPGESLNAQQWDSSSAMWLEDVYALVEKGRSRKAVGVVFREVDSLLSDAEFAACDGILHALDLSRVEDTSVLIAVLSSTLAARAELQRRDKLVQRVREKLMELAPERVNELLEGLE